MYVCKMDACFWFQNIFLLLVTQFYKSIELSSIEVTPKLIPRKIFFEDGDRFNLQLSPDGSSVTFVAPWNHTKNIWLISTKELLNLGSKNLTEIAKTITFDTGRGVWRYTWTHLNNVLLYSQDNDGDENYKLYKVDVESGERSVLSENDGVKTKIMAWNEKYPNLIVIGLNNRTKTYHDLYTVNIETEEKKLLFINNEFDSFIFDNDMKIRLAMKYSPEAASLYYTPCLVNGTLTQNSNWTLYRNVSLDESYSVGLVGFDTTNTKVYWNNAFNDDLTGLQLANFSDFENDVQTIYVPEKADIDSILFHPITKLPLRVYENYLKPTYKILDENFRRDFEILDQIDPTGIIKIISTSLDFNCWLVVSYSDTKSTQYYFYDRLTKKVHFLFPVVDDLKDFDGSPMHSIEVPVSDGFTQVCYLTLPKESDLMNTGVPLHPVPLILYVHGGPWSRLSWGFSSLSQYWANRGYAELRCNFRMSTGYGKKFFNAGFGQWSNKMHQDLLDAVDWAVNKNIADPNRVAIFGASYGGYAALVGLTFTPFKFACGVDLFGPSNLLTLLDSVPDYWKPSQSRLYAYIGADPATEQGELFLQHISPINRANEIVRPLLVTQGLNDVRVVKNESDQMVDAMRDNNIPVTYMVLPNEGHGFDRQENRLAFHALNEQFLQKCLHGRAEPIKDEFNKSKAIIEHDDLKLLV